LIELLELGDAIHLDRLALNAHHRFHIRLSGEDRPVAAHVVIGMRHRPCLALIGGVHGNEYEGIIALHQMLREVGTWRLDGSLIVLPIANPFAFAKAQRRTPTDDKDLNRVFPGSRDGSLSEQLASRLCFDLLHETDLVFTLHGAMADGILAPWIEFLDGSGALEQKTRAAAEASGFDDLIALPRLPGVLLTAMAEVGTPAIEGEVGGLGSTTVENVRYYRERILSVARHVGVLPPTEDKEVSREACRVWHLRGLEGEVGGVFLRSVELRQRVRTGDPLGTIVDASGNAIVQLQAPCCGVIGGYRVHAGVSPGDRLVTLWCEVAK
jgi:predicted deacylase